MENKFSIGQVVNERIRPFQNLIVSRLNEKIYYCRVEEDLDRKELVYFERELKAAEIDEQEQE